MNPWVRRGTGGRRIVSTWSSGVLLPAVLLKSRVKCLQVPNLPPPPETRAASWVKDGEARGTLQFSLEISGLRLLAIPIEGLFLSERKDFKGLYKEMDCGNSKLEAS